jgi:hypothetical protein
VSNRHKVFVSYHHALDESYNKIFDLRDGSTSSAIVLGAVNGIHIGPNARDGRDSRARTRLDKEWAD